MRDLNIAIRSLFKRGRHNVTKIVSLSIGLAIGLVLIAKIYFEQSYDSFYPNADRIYLLTGYTSNENESKVSESVSAIVAPTMKEEVPGIEAATRLTHIGGDRNKFITSDKRRYSIGGILMADSCLFDVLPRPVLSGDPKKVLARPGYAMISRSFAEKLGGIDRAEGTVIASDNKPEMTLTIGGVFEDPPENSHLRYDVLVTLEEADDGGFLAWFGRHYLTYVLLSPGVTPETLRPAIDRITKTHRPPSPAKCRRRPIGIFPETYKGSAYRRSQYPEHDRHAGDPRFRAAVHGRDELYPDCDLGDREP
ncbi:MAG: ABC transporter permease [Alistipes sp.]